MEGSLLAPLMNSSRDSLPEDTQNKKAIQGLPTHNLTRLYEHEPTGPDDDLGVRPQILRLPL